MSRIKVMFSAALPIVLAAVVPQNSFAAEDYKVEVSGYWGMNTHFPSLKNNPALSGEITGGIQSGAALVGVPGVQSEITGGSDFKWSTGGGVAVPLTGSLLATGEFGYERMGSATAAVAAGPLQTSLTARLSFLQMTGGVQYLIGPKDPAAVPFVSVGFGATRQTASASASDPAVLATSSQTVATEYVGGGVRLRFGSSWGIRPEIRLVHVPIESTLGVPGSWYVRTSLGFFWRAGH